MIEKMTVADVDQRIRELKAEIKKWQAIREDVLRETTLLPESRIFINGGYDASEILRVTNPQAYRKKCIEMGYGEDREIWGLTREHFCQKWERAKAKACYHASNRRVKATIYLTEEELKLAKIYALTYAKEIIEYWGGDIRNECWKTYRS